MLGNRSSNKDELKTNGAVAVSSIIAIILAILLYVAEALYARYDSATAQWFVLDFYNGLGRAGVPLLFMLAGAHFLGSEDKFSVKKLYSTRIIYLVSALVFWVIFYNVLSFFIDGETRRSFLGEFQIYFRHLWFVYPYIGACMVLPFLKPFAEKKNVCLYFIAVCFLTSFFYLFVTNFGPDITSHTLQYLTQVIKVFFDMLVIPITFAYSGYFVLGHYLNRYSVGKTIKRWVYAAAVFNILLLLYYAFTKEPYPDLLKDFFSPLGVINASAIFLFIQDKFKHAKPSAALGFFLSEVSGQTFSVYLLQMLFILLPLNTVFQFGLIETIIYVPLISIFAYAVTLVVAYMLGKTPYISNYVLGRPK